MTRAIVVATVRPAAAAAVRVAAPAAAGATAATAVAPDRDHPLDRDGLTVARRLFAGAIVALAAASGCAARQRPPPRPASFVPAPALDDDLPLAPLLEGIVRQAEWLERTPSPSGALVLRFGGRTISRAAYAAALRRFAEAARQTRSSPALREAATREFEFVEARFDAPMLVTAYYQPVVEGARSPGGRFTQPLYGRPPGNDYDRRPGPTRAEIDSGGALAGRRLELCWVDPLDAFVLQTEGSGEVLFADGEHLALDFAGTNGRPHRRLGAALAGRIPADQVNMHTIEAYLRSLPERQMRDLLETNPRYVFFERARGAGARTSIGLPAIAGRTIATDPQYVPKGALAFLVTESPSFRRDTDLQPASWAPLHRFVLDQDTGGGIKGARVDLFWGRGIVARLHANAMKRAGRLYYLVPRGN